MKRIAFLGLLASLMFLSPLRGQNHQLVVRDSAEFVVERYLQLLNYDALPADSLLAIETTITFTGAHDTVFMRRWYMPGGRFRIEVRQNGRLTTGLVTNGKDRFSRYDSHHGQWDKIHSDEMENNLQNYDFRGPLYEWRTKDAQLTWSGTTLYKDQPLQVVMVSVPNMYDRYYMFDPSNGLLVLIVETEKMPGAAENARLNNNHIDWKAIHEYQPLGPCMLVTQESFARNGQLTILTSTARFEPADESLFNRD